MPELLRPAARAALRRWREALIGLAVTLLGLWWASGYGLLKWVGVAVALGGIALTASGIQRGRFRQGAGGPGVVELVEGQLGYFGPTTGGIVAVQEIRRVSQHGRAWVIEGGDGTTLEIPFDAEGAERLFDAFAMLPGLDMHRIVKSAEGPGRGAELLWTRAPKRLH